MRKPLGRLAMMVMVGYCVTGADAELIRIYSFEDVLSGGPDGFFGLGAAVTQDTLGATHLQHSMKCDIGVGGFVGARTETSVPVELNDPPGVSYLLFDVTLPSTYSDTFANVGVTVFGHALNAPGGPQFGQQVQFADEVALAGLAPGTHTDMRIDLDLSVGPYRPSESFNAIFGPGPNDLTVASAFQFYVNKNVFTPITLYIDNVRLGVPDQPGACCGPAGCSEVAAQSACPNGTFSPLKTCSEVTCCPGPWADSDRDGDIDQNDFGAFQACFTGAVGEVPAACQCFNQISDSVIDALDLDAFTKCLSGPAIPFDLGNPPVGCDVSCPDGAVCPP